MDEPKKNRGGRPPKPVEEKAEIMVRVLFSQQEYQDLMRRKRTTRARSLSAFIRAACLERPLILKTETSVQDEKILSQLQEVRSDLLRIGINVNQATRRINNTTDYHDLHRETLSITEKMKQMQAQIQTLMSAYSVDNDLENGSTNQ